MSLVRSGRLAPAIMFAAIAGVYLFFATGGHGSFSEVDSDYYTLLGDAFLSGQLHLNAQPSAGLLALENPYDPDVNGPHRLHDASLYQGRYYLYWGPFPGLVHAAYQGLVGQPVNIGLLQYFVVLLAALAFFGILSSVAREYLEAVPRTLVLLLGLGFALGPAMLYLVSRPSIYNEAPSFGVLFLLLSWLLLLRSLHDQEAYAGTLLLSGLCTGIALASRNALLPYAVAPTVVLGIGVLLPRSKDRLRPLLRALCFGTPVLAICGLLLLYNYARFGSVSEFGMSYVLQGYQEYYDRMRTPEGLLKAFFVPGNIPRGLAIYLFGAGMQRLPDLTPDSYVVVDEPFMPMLAVAPIMLLAPILLVRRLWRSVAAPGPVVSLAIVGFVGASLTLIELSSGGGVTMRYTADLAPGFALAGSLGFMLLVNHALQAALLESPSRLLQQLTPRLVAFVNVATIAVVVLGLRAGVAGWQESYPDEAQAIFTTTQLLLLSLPNLFG